MDKKTYDIDIVISAVTSSASFDNIFHLLLFVNNVPTLSSVLATCRSQRNLDLSPIDLLQDKKSDNESTIWTP